MVLQHACSSDETCRDEILCRLPDAVCPIPAPVDHTQLWECPKPVTQVAERCYTRREREGNLCSLLPAQSVGVLAAEPGAATILLLWQPDFPERASSRKADYLFMITFEFSMQVSLCIL